MVEKTNYKPDIVLPVIHSSFYEAFEKWWKENDTNIREGVYVLKTKEPVPRCLKEDTNGILYIGKGIILNRLGKLINAVNGTEKAHGGGIRFKQNGILNKYRIETLTVEVTLLENSREYERYLLEKYQAEFGELPPLNNQN
jgi:hypothetical protein